jgi:hypothetical protein
MLKLVNRKGQLKSSLVFYEFPTIFLNNMDCLIATARSNKVSTTLAVQDFSQLVKDYGSEQANVITGIVGNVISGQVTGETAKTLSNDFGKISQQKEAVSINSSETSVSRSTQMDFAVPASKIAGLSSGEFVGMVADNPDQKIALKLFHSAIQNDYELIAREEKGYVEIPRVSKATAEDIQENYEKVKRDIKVLVKGEMARLKDREQLRTVNEVKEKKGKKDRKKKGEGDGQAASF